MRIILILCLLINISAAAQINRSAHQLAAENIRKYINEKLFAGKLYKEGSFGEIHTHPVIRSDIKWTIDHGFDIVERVKTADKDDSMQFQSYWFVFYLDKKLNVIGAESYKQITIANN
ncbi:MAG TPA: hypothetical protein VFQ73_13820 [Flavisolibacter sp.]|nr:hypothetical protein [Flavisolibacter sp.]